MIKASAIFFGSLVCCLVASAQTVTNVIDTFNTNGYLDGSITNKWSIWFGNGTTTTFSFDPTHDANSNSASGSLKIVNNFTGTGGEQFTVWNGITGINPALNGIIFTNLQCDIRFAAGSATNSSGNYGVVQFGMGTPSYEQDYFSPSVTIPAADTNWVHVSIPLNVNTDANLYNIANVLIHIYDGSGSLSGLSTLWVDNIQFVGMATNTGTVIINFTNIQQRIDGFGASSAWMSTALSSLDADLLFSTNTGAGLSLLRTRIAPGGVIDDAEGTIAQQAVARGARVWSTPWTPPAALKITNSWGTNAPLNGGWFSNTVANYQTYAADLANYVGIMQNTYGVRLYAVSVQNEPDMFVNYESCEWTSQAIHDFVTNLSAALTASNFTSTKIMLPEKSNWSWNLATNTMNDLITSNLVGILACHNYGSSASAVTQFGTPCPKTLWETEHYFGTDDSITNGLQLAQEIHSFITVAQANAYHYWWLTGSGTGSIADNTANPAKRLFVMGNYSRFVRPNFYRIGATNNSAALISAYINPNSNNFVIVAANPSAIPVSQTFSLTNFPATGTMTQWVTSASLSLSNQGPVALNGNTFNYLLPAWTIVSFVFIQPSTPIITMQPTNQTAFVGGSVTFNIGASGSDSLIYQWIYNGTNYLINATKASLTLTGLTLTNAGNYSVVITNYSGSITSATASLTVLIGSSFVLSASDGYNASSFNSIGGWTNTANGNAATFAPTNGYTYATGSQTLRTPASGGNYVFGGDALTVSPSGSINIKGGNGNLITISNLSLSGTINDAINPNNNAVIAGKMTVVGGASLNTQSTNGDIRNITNTATMYGSGTVTNTGLSATGSGIVIYTGNNSAFTGALIVNGNTVLQAASQANLGGNPASFNAAQLVLDNGILQPTASFSLTNANSGITLNPGGGTINVGSGITLTVSNPIAGAGGLLKIGNGNLVLSGANSYTGISTISNGTLTLTGSANLGSLSISNTSEATLDVSGLAVPLTITNQIALAGNLMVNANSTNTSSRLVASNIVFGGTLTIINSGSVFSDSNSFQFFTASNYSGAFTNIVPTTPGVGLVWDTSKLLVNGTIAVGMIPTVSILPAITNVTYGDSFILSASANGTSPLTYQWYNNQTNSILGAAYSSFTNSPPVAGSGYYSVVVSNKYGRATNYASISVNKAVLTVAANNTNRIYGGVNPAFTASYSGFINGDSFGSSVTGSPVLTTVATTSSNIGAYSIVAAIGSLAATNYSFSFNNGILMLYPAALTISANNTNKVYDSILSFTGTEFAALGLINGDTATNATLISVGTAASTAVGSYPIIVTNALGVGLTNYAITYVNGILTVINGVATNATNILITTSNQMLHLFWPADHIGWSLQSQTNNLWTNWFTLPGTATSNIFSIPINTSNRSVFYRLISP